MRNNEKTPGEKTPKRNLTLNAFAKNASLVSRLLHYRLCKCKGKMCGHRSGCSLMGSLGYERSLICFGTQLNQEVSNISVEDKQATSVVIGALKMKRNYLSLSY